MRSMRTFYVLTLLIQITPNFGLVRLCEKYDDDKSLRCLKSMAGSNGDSYGRIGIINKSQHCGKIRFVKQEWSFDCGAPPGRNAMLQRVFPGEVLRYGDFQQDMVLDFIKPGSCGELRLLECYCGREPVKCGDYLFAATYKRGEHPMLFEAFEASQKYNYEIIDSADDC